MYDLKTMDAMQRDAIKNSRASGRVLYKAVKDKDEGVFSCPASEKEIYGYKLVNEYFVDNSGFGSDNEPALTASQFLTKVKAGFFYGLTGQGQFQVYIGEYEKVSRQEIKKIQAESGIVSSKKVKNNTRLTIYANGNKVLRLHLTDIIKWQDDKIILNNGGWDTVTTRARFNEFLPSQVRVFRKKGVTFVEYCGGIAEYKNGMDIRNTNYINEYNYICGVCGFKFVDKPKNCQCGNDVEFEKITLKLI